MHARDLAKATGGDPALSERVIAQALDPYARWIQDVGAAGAFAPEAPLTRGSHEQDVRL